jgi:hypothetical protein
LTLAADNKVDPAPRGPLSPGANLPGAFHPFNINGTFKGRYHCLVSQHGLDPMVMILARDLDPTDPLKELLKRLDVAVDKNPNIRLAAWGIFLSDDLPDVVTNDDKREELAGKVDDLAKATDLKQVVLGLASKADVDKYGLEEPNTYAVILANKARILASYLLKKDDLTDAKVQEILKQVETRLGAVRK